MSRISRISNIPFLLISTQEYLSVEISKHEQHVKTFFPDEGGRKDFVMGILSKAKSTMNYSVHELSSASGCHSHS
jgi:hypothetical protein